MNELNELQRIISKYPASINRVGNTRDGFVTTKSTETENCGSMSRHTVTTETPSGAEFVWEYVSKNA